MFPAAAELRASTTAHPVFTDEFGERTRTTDSRGEPLELLRLNGTLSAIPSVEPALRERLGRLSGFRHDSFARTRTIDAVQPPRAIVIASDWVRGTRLSTLLAAAKAQSVPLDIAASRNFLRQLVRAVAAWHEEQDGLPIGVIGPERIVITDAGRLVLVESVLGAVAEQLQYSPERYWEELRVAVPAAADHPSIDARSDVTQLGTVALAMMLGRRLTTADYPGGIGSALGDAAVRHDGGRLQLLPPPLYSWLLGALQLDPKHSFASLAQARDALRDALGSEDPVAERDAVLTFLALCPAPDARTPSQATREDDGKGELAAELDEFGADAESVVDLGPQIEAMRAFLARKQPPWVQPTPASSPSPAVPEQPVPESNGRHAEVLVPSEADSGRRAAVAVPEDWTRRLWVATAIAFALGTLVILVVAGFSWPAGPASSGSFSITTNPAGIPVVIDGVSRGATPLALDLPTGEHVVELMAQQERRRIPVTIRAGSQVSHYLELQDRPVAVASPLVLPAVAAPPVVAAAARVEREPNAGGWITVTAPAEVQILENDRLLGTSQVDRIMLPAGRHDLDIVNGTLGVRARRSVQVIAGRMTSVSLEWPTSRLAINAVPWAEVFIEGRSVGETPIGNLQVPVGVHEVIFRHPDLGERRSFVTVTVGETARLAVDLRAK
jgi:hypothetical protein